MCVEFSSRDLNLSLYFPHLASNYSCGMIITPRVCGSNFTWNWNVVLKPKIKGNFFFFLLHLKRKHLLRWFIVLIKQKKLDFYFFEKLKKKKIRDMVFKNQINFNLDQRHVVFKNQIIQLKVVGNWRVVLEIDQFNYKVGQNFFFLKLSKAISWSHCFTF